MIYFNDIEPFCLDWLRNQHPGQVYDSRSIKALNNPELGTKSHDVDLAQFTQVHFFAGIGGWSEALRLARWPADRPIWTGSCPCQPFSSAGLQLGFSDSRHLWPDMFRQSHRFRPAFVVGEQVARGADVRAWLDRVWTDLEDDGYLFWACDLPAASVGAPIPRQRFFWGAVRADAVGGMQSVASSSESTGGRGTRAVPHSQAKGCGQREPDGDLSHRSATGCDASNKPVGKSNGAGSSGFTHVRWGIREADQSCEIGDQSLGESDLSRLEGHAGDGRDGHEPGWLNASAGRSIAATSGPDVWSDFELIHFTDSKIRRLKPGLVPLVDGLPAGNRWAVPRLGELSIDAAAAKRIVSLARTNRTGRIRGYGNAIVPQVAATFLKVWMDVLGIEPSQ